MERRIDVHQLERSVVSIVKLIALPIAVLLGIVLYIPALAVKLMSNGTDPCDRDSMIIGMLLTFIIIGTFCIFMI